jgi:hypothetical protein
MNTEKKNQHYIPKFYLRNFSYNGNKAQIGIFNINNGFFFDKAKLKNQGSKNFFYGYDGVIENSLSDIEGSLSEIVRRIINTQNLPKKKSGEHTDLLIFVGLTHLRNPIVIEQLQRHFDVMKEIVLKLAPKTDVSKIVPTTNHDELISLSLSLVLDVAKNMADLNYKLLINKTSHPFISSDFPVVKYNQFLEQRNWKHGKTGYGNTGLQIFIPINSKIIIIFYDPTIYKVGFRRQHKFEITNPDDVDKLNVLQFINCYETVYFDENASVHYIRKLFETSKKYKRANQNTSKLSYIIEKGEERQKILSGDPNLLMMSFTDCETKLKINGIKTLSRAIELKLHPSIAQLRSCPRMLRSRR